MVPSLRRVTILAGIVLACGITAHAQTPRLCTPRGTAAGTMKAKRSYQDRSRNPGRPAALVGQVVGVDDRPLRFDNHPLATYLTLHRRLGDTLEVARTRTDSNGLFRFDSLAPGSYWLRAREILLQQQWHELLLLAGVTDSVCVRARFGPIETLSPMTTGDAVRRLPLKLR